MKEIPQIAKLLTKLNDLKLLAKAKIAETFSDEAASLARKRLIVGLVGIGANTPLPASFLKDFAVIAGSKLKNGGMKFADFAKQMVEEFGEKVKPYTEKLYREKMIELGLADKIDEVGINNTNLVKLSKSGVYNEKIKWGGGNIEVRPDGAGFWGKRTTQSNSRVNSYELKVNPNNESYFLKHPDGRYVQFENLKGRKVQDGKLVMQVNNSIYRVYDKPEFLRRNILNEAKKQFEAAKYNKMEVEWLISDKDALSQLKRFFKENGVDIKLTYLPE